MAGSGLIMPLHTFESVPEYIAKMKKLGITQNRPNSADWYGYISFQEAMDYAIKGDSRNVQAAMTLLDDLAETIPPTKTFKVVKSPYGGRCNFGDWQSGAPLPMRRRIRTSEDQGPLKIIVSTTSSCGISAKTMQARGITILALLMRLQEIRPVDLFLLAELYGQPKGWSYQLIQMESRPLDLSVASFCLSHVGFARHLTYAYGSRCDDFNGGWPSDYSRTGYGERRRERLNLSPNDLVIGEVHAKDELVKSPKAWLAKQIQIYGGETL